MLDTELQVYAYTRDGQLAHAGPQLFAADEPTLAECRKHERAWRRWRNQYVREHEGSYPLKDDRRNGHVHVITMPDGTRRQFTI